MARGQRLNNDLWLVLPYLRTSRPVEVRGITFRSSSDREHLDEIRLLCLDMLLPKFVDVRGDRLGDIVYACMEAEPGEDFADVVNTLAFGQPVPRRFDELLNRVWEAHALIRAINSSPDERSGRPLLVSERSSLFLCQYFSVVPEPLANPRLGRLRPLSAPTVSRQVGQGGTEGFAALRDWQSEYWFDEAAHVHPHFAPAYLWYTQDLAADVTAFKERRGNRGIARLIDMNSRVSAGRQRRIFSTLDWYGRACQADMSERVALVCLAIAFEALFDLPRGDHLTSRFVDKIREVMGRSPRIEDWARQFYRARSDVVHGGDSSNFWFVPPIPGNLPGVQAQAAPKVQLLRTLTGQARRILQLAAAADLTRSSRKQDVVLSWLFSTFERVTRGRGALRSNKPPRERLVIAATELLPLDPEYARFEYPLLDNELIVSTGLSLLRTYIRATPAVSSVVLALVRSVTSAPTTDPAEEHLHRFMVLRMALDQYSPRTRFGPRDIVREYLRFATTYPHMFRAQPT